MAYRNFTLRKVKQEFGLTIEERGAFCRKSPRLNRVII
jgi:hypothetical protein